jgi:hypothetical protein
MRCLLMLAIVSTALAPARLVAQDDPNDTPLGDVARNLRKKTPAQPVIDDDNLTQVMQQADSRRGFGSSLRLLMSGGANVLRVSAPDVSCSLSFTADVKSLLSSQYAEIDLPAAELGRLEGHASMGDGTLTVPVHNGTDWHVSEIAVAVTVVNKSNAGDSPETDPTSQGGNEGAAPVALGKEKKPDTTVIYRMRAVGVPWAVTTFSSRLNRLLVAADEWHWAIVGARGYPPESYRRSMTSQASTETDPASAIEGAQAAAPASANRPEITPVSNPAQGAPRLVPSSDPR